MKKEKGYNSFEKEIFMHKVIIGVVALVLTLIFFPLNPLIGMIIAVLGVLGVAFL